MPENNDGPRIPQSTSELPQWAQDEISNLRQEAADKRVKLRDKSDELTAALSQVAELKDKQSTAETAGNQAANELLKLTIALDAGVPGERVRTIAGRLQGASEEELKADAAKLIEEFGVNAAPTSPKATDPSQGRGFEGTPVANTPQAEFAQMLSGLDIFKN